MAGLRPDADFMLWKVSERLEDFHELGTAILSTAMGGYLHTPYAYLSMTRRSQYVKGEGRSMHKRGRIMWNPDSKYLLIYPMVKTRAWYQLSKPARQGIMNEHIADRTPVPDGQDQHDLLVRDRRPGVRGRVRDRLRRRLPRPDDDAARDRGQPLHRARHADLHLHRRAGRARAAARSAPASRRPRLPRKLAAPRACGTRTRRAARPRRFRAWAAGG